MRAFIAIVATFVAHALAGPTPDIGDLIPGGFKYALPSLSGQNCVGKSPVTVLTDHSRREEFGGDPTSPRQILVQTYYPARNIDNRCLGEAYATPGFADWISNFLSGNVSTDYFRKFQTHSITNAPFHNSDNREVPLLLFSHGSGVPRKLYQALCEDVASHGYVVVAMEHPWDSGYAEFPDGRIVPENPAFNDPNADFVALGKQATEIRLQDTLFALDQIKNKKVKVPGYDISGLSSHAGMFGHSLGGQLSLVVMLKTPKIVAGTNMDGWFWNGANATNLTNPNNANSGRPYMTMRQDYALLDEFYFNNGGGPQNYVDAMRVQTGPKVMPFITGSLHFGYTDLTPLSIPAQDKGPSKELTAFQVWKGPVNPRRMHLIVTTYHNWFFDNTIKGGHADISKGYKPPFPEVYLYNFNNP